MRNIPAKSHQNAATRITTIKASISIPQHDGSLSETLIGVLIRVVSYVKDVGYTVQWMLWTMFMNYLTVLTRSIQIICNHSVMSAITVKPVMKLRNVVSVNVGRYCRIFEITVTLLMGFTTVTLLMGFTTVTLLMGVLKSAVTLLVGSIETTFLTDF